MGKSLVVTVFEVDDDGDETTLIELRAPVEMLRQFAPQAVAAALGTATTVTNQQLDDARERLQGIGVLSSEGNFGAGQPKRRRRTKAEMEAARTAETEPIMLAEVMPAPEAPTATTTFESAKPVPADNTTEHARAANVAERNAYSPFGG